MDPILLGLKYLFVAALGIEGLLILAALVRLAREKARPQAAPATEE